jgi:AraC-like DNA-binding protein
MNLHFGTAGGQNLSFHVQAPPIDRPRPVTPDHVIRVGGAAALLPLLVDRGIDPEALASEAGLAAAVFADPDSVVPFAALCGLVRLASERTGLPDIGLRACMRAGLPALGLVGYLAAHSETVERGLAALEAYLYVHDQGATPFFAVEGAAAIFGYEVLTPTIPGAEQITFGALAIAANILRSLCGSDFRLHEVTIAYRPPADTSLFRSFFEAPVRFDAERSALAFDRRWLATPIRNADAYLRAVLVEKIHRDIAHASETAVDRIRRVVRSLVAGGKFSVDDTAAAFGIDRRTLARRLSEHGTNFREQLDEARYDEAQRLLRSSAVAVAQVAARLGYSDTATFTRAFRRWAGTAPRGWRARNSAI